MKNVSIVAVAFAIMNIAIGSHLDGAEKLERSIVILDGSNEISVGGIDYDSIPENSRSDLWGREIRVSSRGRATFVIDELLSVKAQSGSVFSLYRIEESNSILVDCKSGRLNLYSRYEPHSVVLRTASGDTYFEGTEVGLIVGEDGVSLLLLLDGAVNVGGGNSIAATRKLEDMVEIELSGGEVAATRYRTSFELSEFIEWTVRYPSVLALEDIGWSTEGSYPVVLEKSVETYRSGNLGLALLSYPEERVPESNSERLFLASMLLGSGQVEEARYWLGQEQRSSRSLVKVATQSKEVDWGDLGKVVDALIQHVSTLNGYSMESKDTELPKSATHWLVESYRNQYASDLEQALGASVQATELAPGSALVWFRRAELEFSHGNRFAAKQSLERGLEIEKGHPFGLSLQGFLQSDVGDFENAIKSFNKALSTDPSFGTASLGLGLVQFAQGDTERAVRSIRNAVHLEPKRSIFRSYLGKALLDSSGSGAAIAGGERRIELGKKELEEAIRLDPSDPTPWFYRSLLASSEGDRLQAIEDLDQAMELNDERSLFRSRLLLDKDLAVKEGNVARVLEASGFQNLAIQEASRSAMYDYSHGGSHQLLSGVYDSWRDPNRINLRYETAWFNELLLQGMLSPVGDVSLPAIVSSNEYTRLFSTKQARGFVRGTFSDRGHIGIDANIQKGVGKSEIGLDLEHMTNPELFDNDDFERTTLYLSGKIPVGEKGQVFALSKFQWIEEGDSSRVYDEDDRNTGMRVKNRQTPLLFAGYKFQHNTNHQTLAFTGRLMNRRRFTDLMYRPEIFLFNEGEPVFNATVMSEGNYILESETEILSLEVQHLYSGANFSWLVGARHLSGSERADGSIDFIDDVYDERFDGFTQIEVDAPIEKTGVYAYANYHQRGWGVFAGLIYDEIEFPSNSGVMPLTEGSDKRDALNGKFGFLWELSDRVDISAHRSQSLGGFDFDDPVRLEPNQMAGFIQNYRSLIPESITGSVSGANIEVSGVALSIEASKRSYFRAEYSQLESNGDRERGAFKQPLFIGFPDQEEIGTTVFCQEISFEEESLSLEWNLILSETTSMTVKLSGYDSRLNNVFPEFVGMESRGFPISRYLESKLTLAELVWKNGYKFGIFSELKLQRYEQRNAGYSENVNEDEFNRLQLRLGKRFEQMTVSLFADNLLDEEYALQPLNYFDPIVKKRSFFVEATYSF